MFVYLFVCVLCRAYVVQIQNQFNRFYCLNVFSYIITAVLRNRHSTYIEVVSQAGCISFLLRSEAQCDL